MSKSNKKLNKIMRDYYRTNEAYREKKKQRMREYMMDRRIKNGSLGNINSILRIMKGV